MTTASWMIYAAPIVRVGCIAFFLVSVVFYHASVFLGFARPDALPGLSFGLLVTLSAALALILYSMPIVFGIGPRLSASGRRIADDMPRASLRIRSTLDVLRSTRLLGLIQVVAVAFLFFGMPRFGLIGTAPSSEMLAYSPPPFWDLLLVLIGGACLVLAVMHAEFAMDADIDRAHDDVSPMQPLRLRGSWAHEVFASGDLGRIVWLISATLVSAVYLIVFGGHLFAGVDWLGTVTVYGLGVVNALTLVVLSPFVLWVVALPFGLAVLLRLERARGSDDV